MFGYLKSKRGQEITDIYLNESIVQKKTNTRNNGTTRNSLYNVIMVISPVF